MVSPSLLQELRCPYSGSELRPIETTLVWKDGEIDSGIVESASEQFPIAASILVLSTAPAARRAVGWIRQQQSQQALAALLSKLRYTSLQAKWDQFCQLLFGIERTQNCRDRANQKITASLAQSKVLSSALSHFSLGIHPEYIDYRSALHSYRSFYAFLPHFQRTDGMVLDWGCGFGPVSHLLSQELGANRVTGVEVDFNKLYLAKRFCSCGSLICLEENASLPWRDATFSAAVLMDVFHYMRNKPAVVRELNRVLRPDGFAAIPHVHNQASHPGAHIGHALTAAEYQRLFHDNGFVASIQGEYDLINSLPEIPDWAHAGDQSQPNLTLFLRKIDGPDFEPSPKFSAAGLRSIRNWSVNPLYEVTYQGKEIRLQRKPESAFMLQDVDFGLALSRLPEQMIFSKQEVQQMFEPEQETLLTKWVINGMIASLPNAFGINRIQETFQQCPL